MGPTLVILAAGMGSRYGGLKQVDPVGPGGETLMDYSVFDAVRAGFGRVVFVIRRDFEDVFRQTIGAKYTDIVGVDYAFQSMDDLPGGRQVPPDRTKPWGTAHAIFSARHVVTAPFAAINADDFYGQDAFRVLATFLGSPPPQGIAGHSPLPLRPRFAMVGYRLDQTLSANGTVARGVCKVKNGLLETVSELTRLARAQGGGVENRETADTPPTLFTGAERVSMNMWGFFPCLFNLLVERFPGWLDVNAANPKAEWYIPFVIDELINESRIDVEVLPTESAWFGVTYRDDKPAVTAAIQALVNAGEYPERLF
ncbi:MAG: NTP transferase domain-containing protein [Kiritimatiellaeota bacterium]|nr:NTP transferase domain-containing protein [Kiritimatiellota bacterium]